MMTSLTHILVVEDDPHAAQMVQFYLERENYTVWLAATGPMGESLFRERQPQLVIMDVALPGFDGLELCRRLRQQSATLPILMLTGRSEDTDKATGLNVGADDYLTKPFSPVELVARIKALWRRAGLVGPTPVPTSTQLGGPRLVIEPTRHAARLDGQPLDLTPTEFKLLETLLTNPGWAFGRDLLLERVWGYQDEAGLDTVTAHMSNLRRKLGPAGANLVRTLRGAGYIYEEVESLEVEDGSNKPGTGRV